MALRRSAWSGNEYVLHEWPLARVYDYDRFMSAWDHRDSLALVVLEEPTNEA